MKRLFVLLLILIAVRPLAAQVRPPADTVVSPDTTRGLAPGTAFYRSLLVPGWGQASVGSYLRGGTFFALQTTSAYMMLKSMARLGEARQVEDRHRALASDSLLLAMAEDTVLARILSNPVIFDAAVDSTPAVRRARGLVNSRKTSGRIGSRTRSSGRLPAESTRLSRHTSPTLVPPSTLSRAARAAPSFKSTFLWRTTQ